MFETRNNRIRLKFAAIDIGSNAIRFQVSSALDDGKRVFFKKLEYVRYPLRLGHDVFNTGKISEQSIKKFMKLMRVYKLLLELYEVTDYMFCATSAIREADNGQALAEQVAAELNVHIEIIDGHLEAELINKAIRSYLGESNYLHIDVGGGSTELNLIINGKKASSRSFKIGSVRVLEHHDKPVMWEDMQHWIKEKVKKEYGRITAVGTGGNISKMYDLAKLNTGKLLSIKKMEAVRNMIEGYTLEERIYQLQMNPDRADVILPASKIYMQVMQWAGATHILVPEVGLKDGMMLHLHERNKQQQKIDF